VPPRLLILLSCLLLATGVAACGSAEITGDVVPKTTPELTPPPIELGDAPAARDSDADTGATGSTGPTGADGAVDDATAPDSGASSSGGGGTATPAPAAPATPAPAAPSTPAPASPAAPAAGGADDGAAAEPDADAAGGTDANPGGASPGGLSAFCEQNPGACGQ